ncbi:MAG: hypothetical protein JWO36_4342 [Myxococcales bacterium]|nr:hypothetical protein [Myxococcales bacterium]
MATRPREHDEVPDGSVTRSHVGVREQLGEVLGEVAAPIVAAITRARRARMFHPEGLTFAARAEAIPSETFGELGSRLDGRVLARCSPALSRRGRETLDVLGIALRFRRGQGTVLDELAEPGDQDLLFATILSPFTMPLSLLTTDASDYLKNEYPAVSPFEVGRYRVKLRLRPIRAMHPILDSRDHRLRAAVAGGRASWRLDARQTLTRSWQPIARISFERLLDLDQDALRFDPFRAGAGFVPVGVVQTMRRAVYAAGQRARAS